MMDPTVSERAGLVEYTVFDRLLDAHVQQGRVDYEGFRRERADLQVFLDDLARINPKHLLTAEDQLVFWVNAYNAVNIQGVVDHLPLGSVKDVPGFFNRLRYRVAGESLTIDDIERRARAFKDYRVHFTLTCASRGAPWLRSEAYDTRRFEGQLEEQARSFLADSQRGFRLEEAHGEAWLSKIFQWSSPDMVGSPLPNVLVAPFIPRRILATIQPYLDPPTQRRLQTRSWRIRYFPYDWRLNGTS